MKIAIDELHNLVTWSLVAKGLLADSASTVASTIVAAERDGSRSHGLQRLAGYLSSLSSGWVDGTAEPSVEAVSPALLRVDARNGFAQVALAKAAPRLRAMAQAQGTAVMATANSHHFAALWPDVEPFAADGFIALTMVHARPRMVTWGGTKRALGTNPMAFACPRRSQPPLVFDQASSIMSQGELLLASAAKRSVPDNVGVDRDGKPTTDPDVILQSGALLPFGGPKGSSLAFMIEILSAALSGAPFGFEDTSTSIPGAVTPHGGQFLLLIDPNRGIKGSFVDRVEKLIGHLLGAGSSRMPADHRYERRRISERDGVEISSEMYELLFQRAQPPAA